MGLSTFVNNLPGGKSLRDKVRKLLSKQSDKLKLNLQATDPEGKYSNSISGVSNIAGSIVGSESNSNAGSQSNPNQAEINRLEKEKKQVQLRLPIVATNPILLGITIKKIKEIDAKLKKLKNS